MSKYEKYSNQFTENRLIDAQKRQQTQLNQQIQQQQIEQGAQNDASFWEKLGATFLDTLTELGGGLLKGVEGIVDLGISAAGALGSVFGADTKWAEDAAKFNATEEWYYNAFEDNLTQHSVWNEATIVKETLSGFGQALPGLALNFIPGAGPALSVSYFTGSAAGSGVETALNDGANFNQALLFGGLQGGVEGLIEFATKKMGKGIYSLTKSIGNPAVKTTAKTVGKTMLEEATSESIESILSGLATPWQEAVSYKGKSALESYKDWEYYKENVLKQGLVGGLVGGLAGGSSAAIRRASLGGQKNFSIAQSTQELSTLETKMSNLYKNDKLSPKQLTQIEKQKQVEIENIGTQLRAMPTNEDRANVIKQFGMEHIFNKQGEYTGVLGDFNSNLGNDATTNLNAVSPSLRGKQLLFNPTNNKLTESSKQAKKFVMTLDPNAKTVFTDDLPGNVKAFYDTNAKAMYISNNISTKELMGHELTHSLEGTEAYEDLKAYVLDNLKVNMGEENYNELVAKKIKAYSGVNQKQKTGKSGGFVALYEAETEIVADEMGKLLSEAKSIERLIQHKRFKVVRKIWQWIKDVIAKLIKRGERGEYYQYMRNAERLYAKAIHDSIGGVSLGQVKMSVEEAIAEFERRAQEENAQNAEVDNENNNDYNEDTRYSLYSQYETEAKSWAFNTKTRNGDVRVLFNPKDNTWNKLVANDSIEEGYSVVLKVKDTQSNFNKIQSLLSEVDYENNNKKRRTNETLFKSINEYRNRKRYGRYDSVHVEERRTNGFFGELDRKKSTVDRGRNSQTGREDNKGYLLKDNLEHLVKEDEDIDNGEVKEYNDGRYKYKPRDVGEITQKDFFHHYWAIANNIVSEKEISNFTKKIAELKNGTVFKKNADGLFMVPVGENGIENKIVFTNGNFEAPSIQYVIEINSKNETDLSYLREELYEYERRGIWEEDKNTFEYYSSKDFTYSEFKKSISNGYGKNSYKQSKRRGTAGATGEDGRFALDGQDLWDTLSKEEQAKLYRAIDELHHQDYHKFQLPNGNYLIDVKNKIIETDGQFQRPQIIGIVEFTGFNNQISKARDYFYEQAILYGQSIQESIDFINRVFKEEVATLNTVGDGRQSGKRAGQRGNNQSNRATFGARANRTRIFGTTGEDVRYSLETDSNGTKLSEEQSEFFKDSKVRDDYGNLKVVYHGTVDGSFNEFKYDFIGRNGTSEGKGFYFTDDIEYAEAYTGSANTGMFGYSKEHTTTTKTDKSKLFRVYLNICKPLSTEKKTITKSQLTTLIKNMDKTGNNYLSNWGDVQYDGYDNVLRETVNNVYEFNENDVDLIHELLNGGFMSYNEFYDLLRKTLGYDGIISKEGNRGTFYIVFNSNQIKGIDNKFPSESNDIRYALGGLDNTVEKGYNEHRRNTSVTREEFTHHYWAKANNILDDTEIAVFMRKVGELKSGNYFEQNADGLYMIAVGKDGIDNKIVFTDGDYNNPSINMVVEIKSDNETDLDNYRRVLFDYERRGIQCEIENIFNFNYAKNANYSAFKERERTTNTRQIDRNNKDQSKREGIFGTTGEDGRFALDSQDLWDTLSKEEFFHHYWAKANNILDDTEIAVFMRKVGELKSGNYFEQNADGLYMIAVGKDGIDNKIVFTDGDYSNPSINMVVEIKSDNETDLSYLRGDVYECETRGVQAKDKQFFNYYYSRDFSYSQFEKDISDSNGKNSSGKQKRRGTAGTTGEDGRFALDGTSKGYSKFSKGQVAKVIAEHTRKWAYSRSDAEEVINTVVAQNLSFGDKYGQIVGKSKKQVIDQLWHAYNTRKEGVGLKVVEDIAEYIINNATAQSVFAEDIAAGAMQILAPLQKYLHVVDLDSLKADILNRYDNQQAKIYARWGKRKGMRGLAPDEIAQELKEDGVRIKSNTPADILFELNDMWEHASETIKTVQKQKLKDLKENVSLQDLKIRLRDEILNNQDKVGHKSEFAKIVEHYLNKTQNLKTLVVGIKRLHKAKNNVAGTIEQMRDMFIKDRPAGWDIPKEMINLVRDMVKVETWRNNISKNAREYIKKLEGSLNKFVFDDQEREIFPYRELIEDIASGQGELSADELFGFDKFLRSFIWHVKNYGKVEFEGKAQDIDALAGVGVQETREAKEILKKNDSPLNRLRHYVYDNPYERFAEMGLWQKDSIMQRIFADMKEGTRRRAEFVRDTNYLYQDFYKENKNYLKTLQENITIGEGAEALTLPKRQALTIYMTSLREQGRSHLFNQGFEYGVIRLLDNKDSTKGKMIEAFAKGVDVRITQSMINQIENSLTKQDKKFLEITSKFFNTLSKNAKKQTDEKLFGVSNIEDDFYFPLKVSSDKIFKESGQANNNLNQYVLDMGMNKSTKPNANNKLTIDGIENIVAKHINDMSMYVGYAIPLNAYNKIMNRQVGIGNSLDETSNMRAEIQKIDTKFEKFADKLWRDMQGFKEKEENFFDKTLDFVRWSGATAALSANPKVLLTQILSLSSALSEFNPKYVAKGALHFFGEKEKVELGKYSALMWERMQIGNSIDVDDIRKNGSKLGKIGKTISSFSTKPISWMDSNVIRSLWFASQYEVAEKMGKGYEVGTEANKIEAGRRLDDIVFRTQQTTDPLGRSEWLRSNNALIKFARMFTSDAMQLAGKMISAVRRLQIAQRMIKSSNLKLVNKGNTMLKEAKIGVAKATNAMVLNQAILLAIELAFKWLKGLGDDEEWDEAAHNTALANIIGLLPFGGDVADLFAGYEPTNMAYTALSSTVKIITEAFGDTSALLNGEYLNDVELRGLVRKTFMNIGRLTGIPVQNIETYALKVPLGKFLPTSREEYDALFNTKANSVYFKKIQEATQNGNEELADTIINIMFNKRTGKIKNDNVLALTRNLVAEGYDVIPRNVGKSITFSGEEYKLTARQHSNFQTIYSQANDTVLKMTNSSNFNKLDNSAKAKALNFVYTYYYNLAIEDMLGEDLENKNLLFANIVPVEELAMAVSQANMLTASYDKNGNAISGSKKAKVQSFVARLKLNAAQKYAIMGYLGYSNTFGAGIVFSAINRQNLSKKQKKELYKMCGY